MVIDTSFINDFYQAEQIDTYDELIAYMKQFNKDYYKKNNIYIQKHHIIPSFECEDLDKEEEIWLPIVIHFKAHLLRAREYLTNRHLRESDLYKYQELVTGNYTEAFCILKPFKQFQFLFQKEWKEAEKHYQSYFRAKTYEAQFGKRKADRIKTKISIAMKSLPRDIIEKRNQQIKLYAMNRPQSHNDAIARGKRKMIFCINNKKLYYGMDEIRNELNISKSSIQKSIKTKKPVKGLLFEYLV